MKVQVDLRQACGRFTVDIESMLDLEYSLHLMSRTTHFHLKVDF